MNLKNSPFQKGLYMKVPKGTPLASRWGHDKVEELTKRDVIVEISDLVLPNSEQMLTRAEVQERQSRQEQMAKEHEAARHAISIKVHYPAVTHPGYRGQPGYTQPAYDRMEIDPAKAEEWNTLWRKNHDEAEALRQEYIDLGDSRYGPDEVLVGWSKGDKWAKAKHLEIAEKPEARKKEPKVNLRQQMVPKSRWEFTQDLDIYYGAPNPAFHAIVDAWDKANPRPNHNHTRDPIKQKAQNASYQKWAQDRQAMRSAAEKSPGEYLPQLYRSIKAGDIFEVTGKFNSYWNPYGWAGEKYGNAAEVVFDGKSATQYLEYSMIKDAIKAISIPTVKAFVLRHKETGLFYKSYEYDTRWSSSDHKYKLEYGDTFMKGKKWDNIGKAKTSILMMTGYYAGLPGADEALPEWQGGSASMTKEQLEEFDLVEFDKLSRKEVGVVAEFAEWFKRSWELRALTVKYGSAVRTTYKALEKSKLLDKQKGMVVFTVTDQDKLDNIGYYSDEKTALTEDDKDEIKLATASMAKGTFKSAVDHKSMAVSFPNKGAAMMFKLSYNGSLKINVIDLEDMKEAVND